MTSGVDLLIVGAGPAGMSAAVRARALGLEVLVADDQPAPGGQIWRGVETVAGSPRGAVLGPEYRSGAALAEAFRASGASYEPGSEVWQFEPGWRVFATSRGRARVIEARCVLLATGAQERPAPFPGWTLPGVLTVGAAQILLKTSGQIPADPVWIAGSGPLPLLYAVQLLEAGGRIAGWLDTTPPGRRRAAARHLPGALRNAGDLTKGLRWLAALRRAGVPVIRHVEEIEAHGDEAIKALRYRTVGGEEATVPASLLLVHEGVIPGIHTTLALGCAHEWHAGQACYVPILDRWGETTCENIFVAGDGAAIGGAQAACPAGELAAIGIAQRLGRVDANEAERLARPVRGRHARALAARPFLDALFRPRRQIFTPSDATVVCRCEEVTAGEIRAAAGVGRPGPNQVKAFTRAGMGPCQGRQCGYTVAHVLAALEGRPVEEVGFYRVRPPLKPVTLGELASLDAAERVP